jgi:hypothetical protein
LQIEPPCTDPYARWCGRGGAARLPPIPIPDAFLAPAAETAEDAVPITENLRQVTPWRSGAHDPENSFDKHPVVAPGRTALVRPAYDQPRYQLPLRIAQYQTIQNAQSCLPQKTALNHKLSDSRILRVHITYASIGTNLLFFEKGEPTKDIWFYEHRVPDGQKAYSMTKPIRFEHLQGCIDCGAASSATGVRKRRKRGR